MEELYLGWLEQVERALAKWDIVKVDTLPRSIVITGMGGSGCVGDYVVALANNSSEWNIPVITIKHYKLPSFISKNDLVYIISYSGNTLETLRSYKEALEKKSKLIIITSNGSLYKEAMKKNIPVIKVIEGIAPRTALPEMLLSLLATLDTESFRLISKSDVIKLKSFLEKEMKEIVNNSYKISQIIYEEVEKGNNMVIAVHTPYEVLAIRGKNEFNENSKIPAKIEVMPEWAHNDIVGWEQPPSSNWFVVMIEDKNDEIGFNMLMFMKKQYEEKGINVIEVPLKGSNLLEKIMYGSLLLGLTSVRLARLRKVDPLATTSIVEYKKFVKQIL